MKKIFVGLVITAFALALTACNGNDVSIAATQQVQAATTQNTFVQLSSQPQDESSVNVIPLIEGNFSFRILGTIEPGEAVFLGRMEIEHGTDYNFDIRFGINMGGVYVGLSPYLYGERFFTNDYETEWTLIRNGGRFQGSLSSEYVYVYIIAPESSWVVDVWGSINAVTAPVTSMVSYEMARQIAIDYAGIAKPDVANLRSIMNLISGDTIWDFTVAGEGLMISVQIDSDTGEIVRSQRFDGVWSTENFPVSFDEAVRIAIDHVNIATPFIAYFHGHTTLPNGNQFWRVHIVLDSGLVVNIRVDSTTGEITTGHTI